MTTRRGLAGLLDSFMAYDPAASSRWEVLLLYPGVKAIAIHRVAHALYRRGWRWLARAVAECGRWLTLIEIHPGAVIGSNVIIDHGIGTVIGETTVIGDGVIIYQGVTLGGTSLSRGKRHPTIEDNVVIGAGAKVLGNIVVGRRSRVGANSVVIASVPPEVTVAGIPAKVVGGGVKAQAMLDHHDIVDMGAGI